MDSDTKRRPADGGFNWPSPGLTPIFRCDKCGQQRTTTGRKQIRRGGMNLGWKCRECV